MHKSRSVRWDGKSTESGSRFFSNRMAAHRSQEKGRGVKKHTHTSASRYSGVPFDSQHALRATRDRQFFNILTRKSASRYSGTPFLDIKTSKSAPGPSVFQQFDLQMCF